MPEKALNKEQSFYNNFMDTGLDGLFYKNSTPIAIVNDETGFEMVNDAFCAATGYSREEVMTMQWTQLATEDMVDELIEKKEKRKIDPNSVDDDYEVTFYNKQGGKEYAQMAVSFLPLLDKKILAFLLITKQRKALMEIESRTITLEKEIKIKDIEITNYLLKLSNNNKLGEQISSKLKEIGDQLIGKNKSLIPEINDIIHDMEYYRKIGFWETLDDHFNKTHPQFSKNLFEKHSSLSPAETKLATLLSLELSTKDIAGIMIQSYDSVRVARTRLRKKLGLTKGISLQAYFFSLL